jgi:hypothetical protein
MLRLVGHLYLWASGFAAGTWISTGCKYDGVYFAVFIFLIIGSFLMGRDSGRENKRKTRTSSL